MYRRKIAWTTFKKEAFKIFHSFRSIGYLFLNGKSTHVFTDHRNFLTFFSPLTLHQTLWKQVVWKFHQWAIYLSIFSFANYHVYGKENVFSGILNMWTNENMERPQWVQSTSCSKLRVTPLCLRSTYSGLSWNKSSVYSTKSIWKPPRGHKGTMTDCGKIQFPTGTRAKS